MIVAINTVGITVFLLYQLNDITTIAFPFMYASMLIGEGVDWIKEKQSRESIQSKVLRMLSNSFLSSIASITAFVVVNATIILYMSIITRKPVDITSTQIKDIICSLVFITIRMMLLFSISYTTKKANKLVVGEILVLIISFVDFYGYIVRHNIRPLFFAMGEHTIFDYSYGFSDYYQPNRVLAAIYWICIGFLITLLYYLYLRRKHYVKSDERSIYKRNQ